VFPGAWHRAQSAEDVASPAGEVDPMGHGFIAPLLSS
jgi:hypothetical protein